MVPTYDELCNGSSMGSGFLQNIKVFLEKQAEIKTCHVSIVSAPNVRSCWYKSLEFYNNGNTYKIPLYILDEDHRNTDHTSPLPICDYCRGAGWGHHVISRQNFHFIIPKDGEFVQPEEEEQMFEKALKKGLVMDVSNCALYGLIHGNGYGHLITIHRSKDCEFFTGIKIMQLWDRICTVLGTRNISLKDVAKKGPMDLRLLYAVALEHTWFGQWGYSFCRGSFGVMEARYEEALESLKSLTLEEIADSCTEDNERRKQVERIIKYYKGTSTLLGNPKTIKDLFNRMLLGTMFFQSTAEKRALAALAYSLYDGSMEIDLQEDEASVADRIVDSLKRKRQSSVWTKRTDLLGEYRSIKKQADKVLKKLDGKRVGDHIIDKRTTSSVEYKVYDVGVPGSNVYNDLIYMYQHIFIKSPGPQSDSIKSDTQAVLDVVQFVKEYTKPTIDQRQYICQLLLKGDSSVEILNEEYWEHGEILVVVPPGATFGDLKQEACRAIKETYCFCGAQHIVVEAIEGYGGLEDTSVVPEELVGSRGQAVGLILNIEPSIVCLKTYQGGQYTLTEVNCTRCGAREDDGEPMVSCVSCRMLQHQRCHQLHEQPSWVCTPCGEIDDGPNTNPTDDNNTDHPVPSDNTVLHPNYNPPTPSVAGPSHHPENIGRSLTNVAGELYHNLYGQEFHADHGSNPSFNSGQSFFGIDNSSSHLVPYGIGSSSGHTIPLFHNSNFETGTSSNPTSNNPAVETGHYINRNGISFFGIGSSIGHRVPPFHNSILETGTSNTDTRIPIHDDFENTDETEFLARSPMNTQEFDNTYGDILRNRNNN